MAEADEEVKEEVVEEKVEEVGDGEEEDARDSGIHNANDPFPDCRSREGLDFHRGAYPKVARRYYISNIGIVTHHQEDNLTTCLLVDHSRIVQSTLAT